MDTETTFSSTSLAELELEFLVSADQEYWEMIVRCRDRETHLRGRAFGYVLLLLARRRVEESQCPTERPATSVGWVAVPQLLRDLGDGYTRDRLNSHIHQARRLLATLGVTDADGLVERRPNDTLRLGRVRFVERDL